MHFWHYLNFLRLLCSSSCILDRTTVMNHKCSQRTLLILTGQFSHDDSNSNFHRKFYEIQKNHRESDQPSLMMMILYCG